MIKKYFSLLMLIFASSLMSNAQNKINISIDGRSLEATLAENVATKALVNKLQNGPVKITMTNYGGFEKVGELPWSLPTDDSRITTSPGDIMLYLGNNIVIFYGQNTWSYTPLGSLETSDPSIISNFVGSGSKTVTISLVESASFDLPVVDGKTKELVFNLSGAVVSERPLAPGIYIVDNKKVLVK